MTTTTRTNVENIAGVAGAWAEGIGGAHILGRDDGGGIVGGRGRDDDDDNNKIKIENNAGSAGAWAEGGG